MMTKLLTNCGLTNWIIKNHHVIVRCFRVSDKLSQTTSVIWFSTTWLLIFRLEIANKKPLFTNPASMCIEISC